MSNQCQWIDDPKIGPWFLPGCMGGAIDEAYCTCEDGVRTIEEYHRLQALEAKVDRLASMVERLLEGQ
jgi:hypothetical protein